MRSGSIAQFEAAVGEAFERKGYKLLRGNSTRNGGDADHVFSMPGFDDVSLSGPTPLLIVQVKHKKGTDENDVEGVNQLIKWKPADEGEAVCCKVLFSSAKSFTEKCKRIAEANDVTLICGTEAGLFML